MTSSIGRRRLRQTGAPDVFEDDEISLQQPLLRTLWGYRRFIGAAVGAILIVFMVGALVVYVRQLAQHLASLEFRLVFEGVDKREYPNGTTFSTSDILSPPVLTQVYETNKRRAPTGDLVRRLSRDGVKVNVTALLSLQQVKHVARSVQGGASALISVFAGRLADTGRDPVELMTAALELARAAPNAELIWAARESCSTSFRPTQSAATSSP